MKADTLFHRLIKVISHSKYVKKKNNNKSKLTNYKKLQRERFNFN